MTSPHRDSEVQVAGDNTLVLRGQVQADGVRFESRAQVSVEGGQLTAGADSLQVTGATALTIRLAAATNFANFRELTADPAARCALTLLKAADKSWEALKQQHLADHQPLFRRVQLDLGRTEAARRPTDERIAGFAGGQDPQLAALAFQYGRYLLIGSSRPGGQPANLQGIWNESLRPPWDSKYTCNINTEMNYWPAEVANLAECTEPLFDALDDLVISGRETAKAHYGARGWVLHHNFDLWRGTAPINASNHGIWVTGGAWLSLHLWEHYLYSQDRGFLRRRAYPVMKEAALFFADFLVEDPKTGWLISGPSNSPEQGGLVMGPTMDHQIIRSLFGACIEAAQVLGTDQEFAAQLAGLRQRIAPNQIGKHGQLQEWLEDKDDPKNQHRHVSHLWGAYPGCDITWQQPELFRAARQSLIFRGDAATGWSMGWKVNLWARFLDGDHAYLILQNLLGPVGRAGKGGMYPEPVRRASALPDRRQLRRLCRHRRDAAAKPRADQGRRTKDEGAARSRGDAIFAPSLASLRPSSCTSSPRCLPPGPTARCGACGRGAASRSIWTGRTGSSRRRPSAARRARHASCVTATRRPFCKSSPAEPFA